MKTKKTQKLTYYMAMGDYLNFDALIDQGEDINFLDDLDKTPLYFAVDCGLDGFIKHLLAHPTINVNAGNDLGTTPLHLAAARGRNNYIEALLEKKANINAIDNYNATPLYEAVKSEKVETVRLLIARGANVNIAAACDPDVNRSNFTPLHHAALSHHLGIMKILIEAGADHELQTGDGKSARYFLSLYHRDLLDDFDKIIQEQSGRNILSKESQSSTTTHISNEDKNFLKAMPLIMKELSPEKQRELFDIALKMVPSTKKPILKHKFQTEGVILPSKSQKTH